MAFNERVLQEAQDKSVALMQRLRFLGIFSNNQDEFIKLGQLLKLADMVQDGVEAKYVITDGLVKVNGEVDDRRGRKVYEGDIVSYDGKEIKVIR